MIEWIKRFFEAVSLGRTYSEELAGEHGDSRAIYRDMLKCNIKYRMHAGQYRYYRFCELTEAERKERGERLKEKNTHREKWKRENEKQGRILARYSNPRFDTGVRAKFRNRAYRRIFDVGENFYIESNVDISRGHYFTGNLIIKDNVQICRNTVIDYTGTVYIGSNTVISQGCSIFSHTHIGDLINRLQGVDKQSYPEKSKTVIKSNVWIGTNCVILPGSKIGKNVTLCDGSVVDGEIPDNVIAGGNPVEIIEFKQAVENIEGMAEIYGLDDEPERREDSGESNEI